MIAYADTTAEFQTPGGRPVQMTIRQETNDWNTVYSCLNGNEYDNPPNLQGVALDIGAYIGGVAIGLAIDNPELRVIAVEPVPDNLRLLRQNIEQNGVADRVTVIDGAVGMDKTAIIRWGYRGSVSAEHHAFVGNTSMFGDNPADCEESIVPTFSIADMVPEGRITWAKIDCEGGEWDFVKDPDLRRIDLLVGEWHPVRGHKRIQFTRLLGGFAVEYSGPKEGPGGFRAFPVL